MLTTTKNIFFLNLKIKSLKKKYIIKKNKPKIKNNYSNIIKMFLKLNIKNKMESYYKIVIKLYFIFLKFLKFLNFNLSLNKFVYNANFNKLKNKNIISKNLSIKNIQKTKKNKNKKDENIKNLNLIAFFLFSFILFSNKLNKIKTFKNKTLIYSNFFMYIINIFDNLITDNL